MKLLTRSWASLAQRHRPDASSSRRVIAAIAACFCLSVFSSSVQAALIGFALNEPGNAGFDKPFDQGWVARLQGQGHNVVLIGDGEALPAPYQKNDFDLFIVSGDIASGAFIGGPIGLNSNAAQIIYENAVLDEIFAASGSSPTGGGLAAQTSIEIIAPAHPLAAGLPAGLANIFSAAAELSRLPATGPWNPNATVIAESSDGGAAIIELRHGRPNPTGAAQGAVNQGLKIAFFPKEGGDINNYTPAGLALLDAAVRYGLANKVPEPTSSALLLIGLIAAGLWRKKSV